ncbi:hypothetical protein D3C76_1057660 [compost metagenome]
MALKHRLALLAEGQLHFAVGVEQVSVAKALRQQFGNQRLGLVQWQIAGDVAGLVAVDQRQVGLPFHLHGLADDALQGLVGTDMARQHQLDQRIAVQGGTEQVKELGARIRRRRSGSTGGHGKQVPRIAGARCAMPRILHPCQLQVQSRITRRLGSSLRPWVRGTCSQSSSPHASMHSTKPCKVRP